MGKDPIEETIEKRLLLKVVDERIEDLHNGLLKLREEIVVTTKKLEDLKQKEQFGRGRISEMKDLRGILMRD